MNNNTWKTDADGFVQAVKKDEYAELVLPTGDVLVTDWESDGTYFPYVVPTQKSPDQDQQEAEIMAAIYDKLGCRVNAIEYSPKNEIYVPYMERPS